MEAFADIPNEASIKAAKEKRERLRQLGVTTGDSSDDFISLSLVSQDTSRRDQGPHPESRLQREDDDLGEGDDGEQSKNMMSTHINAVLRPRGIHRSQGEDCTWQES